LPTGPVNRLIMLIGRRGGKDRFMSACAIHRAALSGSWRAVMSAGEQAAVILLGADKKQSRILRRYCQGLLASAMLAAEVTRTSDEMIEFKSAASLEVVTNDANLVRGRSAIAVLGSECCYWDTREGAASSDEDVVAAALPAMSMTPDGGVLVMASSVGRRAGFMHRKWKELFGVDDAEDVVWLASSRTMNPQLSEKVVAKAYADDPQRAKAEFGSEWRDDLAAFLDRALVEAAVDTGVLVRPRIPGVRYHCFVDVSGGVSDAYAVAIAHKDGDKVVLDCLVSRRAPFNPATVNRRHGGGRQVVRNQSDPGRSVQRTMGGAVLGGEWNQVRAQRSRSVRNLYRHVAAVFRRPGAADRQSETDQPAMRSGKTHDADSRQG
jgi:hypothetical protein